MSNTESFVSNLEPDYHWYLTRDDIPNTYIQKMVLKNLIDPDWINSDTYAKDTYCLQLIKRFGQDGISRWVIEPIVGLADNTINYKSTKITGKEVLELIYQVRMSGGEVNNGCSGVF